MKCSTVFIAVIACIAAACSTTDIAKPTDPDVTSVFVSLAGEPIFDNGFGFPTDTVKVQAVVLNERGQSVGDRPVTWQLQLQSGELAGDSIARIAQTDSRTASVVFSRSATVSVIASVARNDGIQKTGVLYLRWSR